MQRLQSMNLINRVLVGFGIKDQETFRSACLYANGAIVGSAFIQAITGSADIEKSVKQFISAIK